MFQTILGCSEEDFKEVTNAFYEHVCKEDLLEANNTFFDLTKVYKTNHACIWNKINNVGKECRIVAKNDKVAHVQFKDCALSMSADSFYRLEDLQEVASNGI